MRRLDYVTNALDKNTHSVSSPDELLRLVRSEANQLTLKNYRMDLAMGKGKDSPWKKLLIAIIPQALRLDANNPSHKADDMVDSGWIFIDDDRDEISAQVRYAQFLARLAELGIADCPHVAMESASRKLHILVPKLDMSLGVAENHTQWAQLLTDCLVLDPSTKNRNKLMFCTGRILGGDLSLLFADVVPQVSLSQDGYSVLNCHSVQCEETCSLAVRDNVDDGSYPLRPAGSLAGPPSHSALCSPRSARLGIQPSLQGPRYAPLKRDNATIAETNCQISNVNCELGEIAASITQQLGDGSLVVAEGNRNNMLYAVARQMAYIEGISKADVVDALRALDFYGLPEREAIAAIRSALGHEKTWLYKLPDELANALGQSDTALAMTYQQEQPEVSNSLWATANTEIEPPALIKLFTPLVPENAREAVAAMVFSPLGTFLNNAVTIRDVSGKRRNLQFTTIIVGNSSSGKGFSDTISDLITERHRLHDLSSWTQITAWQEQKRTTPKGEPQPLKPVVPLRLLSSNMTEPALLERLSALEPMGERAFIKVSEIDDLRKMQSAGTKLGAGQEIILSAFDTSKFGALRVSADAISAMTVMSVNILASSTFPGTQDFFRAGIERGSVGRCDIAIVPDSYDVPRYQDPTPEFYEQLSIYLDRLESASGEIVSPDIDRVIEEIRLTYSNPESPLSHHQNPEYYKLCHRQLLITKQKATMLYICNDYQWDASWEPWLHHAFNYGMECKLTVFASEIASWEKRQCMATTPRISTRGPKSELSQLGNADGIFTLAQLVALKRTNDSTATDEELTRKAKTLIRTWVLRKHIAPTDNEGEYQKL
ncbi:MAG: DUF3987 domain-containing protein [Bacteroidaceae bacterium]|nr:DUF3987 domain-containing protein [Bacteroidaceae bacterium]